MGGAGLQKTQVNKPLYWNDKEQYFTLHGLEDIDPHSPVCHVNFYEADAFARWAGARLPTEMEWEYSVQQTANDDTHFMNKTQLHPKAAEGEGIVQCLGHVWEWTSSSYLPYPGFQAFSGKAQEYNGKFMCNQMVLRGGSCVTPEGHIRPSYRNFFYPTASWQFSGIRLAKDMK